MRFRLLALVLCFGLAGCSHYQLGTTGRLKFTTLYITPVANHVATLAQAQVPVTTQLRQTFEEDGRVVLVNSPQEADATLTVILSDYHREVAAVRETDTGLASKFTVTLGATCSLRDNRNGVAFFENRVVTVSQGVYVDNGMPHSSAVGNQLQSEYNTVPLLAGALATKLSHVVLDVW